MTGQQRRGDKFANPTNAYQHEEAAKIEASGKRRTRCPGCNLWRWIPAALWKMPGWLCDACILNGRPRSSNPPPIAQSGGLCARQRAKKGHGG